MDLLSSVILRWAVTCKAQASEPLASVLLGLPVAPFSGELGLSFLQNPWCRPATSGASAVLIEAALLLTLGALLDVELGAPWLALGPFGPTPTPGGALSIDLTSFTPTTPS
jgi:hypothetical protein